MGFSTIVNTISARPKGWSPKKKKGHLMIRSGFGGIHRPKNAKNFCNHTGADLSFFFFFFGNHPFGFAGLSMIQSGQALKKRDVW